MENENPRKNIIKLMLGPIGETWGREEAYQQTLNKLKNLNVTNDVADAYFLRELLTEIIMQTPAETYDFRGISEFYEAKTKKYGAQLRSEFIEWARRDWAEKIKCDPFAVEFPEFTVYPTVLNEDTTEATEFLHLVTPDKIDQITSIPADDHRTIEEWRKQLGDGKMKSDKLFDIRADVHILSTKQVAWRFGLYDLNQMDKRLGEPLKDSILNFAEQQIKKFGGIQKEILFPKDLNPVSGILGKFVVPAYKVQLKNGFRNKLLGLPEQNVAKPKRRLFQKA